MRNNRNHIRRHAAPMDSVENAIEVRGLTKDYGQGRGVFDAAFDVRRGEVTAIMGANGAGKTTTIRHMMGFLKGQAGRVTIEGMDAWRDAADIKRITGYVPGQIDFPDVGSGTNFLRLQADMMGLRDMSEANALIDRFAIDITAPLRRMSKGMKQKMALVVAFMGDADIYLLDEPSTGLDPLMRDALIDLINEKKRQGKTVFMSSHVFKEIADTADTVLFIDHGRITGQVDRSQFTRDPRETYAIRFATEDDYRRYLSDSRDIGGKPAINRIEDAIPEARAVRICIPAHAVNAFMGDLAGYGVAGFSSEPYSLEKYYTTVIEKSENTKTTSTDTNPATANR